MAGYQLAREVCSPCHAIEADAPVSPHVDAPPFADIAVRPEMTPLALAVWFRSPHLSMPNLVISKQEASDLIAYITGLNGQ